MYRTLEYLREYCRDVVQKHPVLSRSVWSIYGLAVAEINCGESEDNEVTLAINDIDDLISQFDLNYIYAKQEKANERTD